MLLSTAAGLLAAPPAMASTTTSTTAPAPTAAAALLVDVDTGRALVEQNDHTPLPPGSLTKTLTAMIAADWLPPASTVPVTAAAFNAYPDKVGMKPGQLWPLAITLHALITDSANDAAYALAIDIGGSLQGFGPIMREAASEIGMDDHPVLEDPAGLDGSEGVDGGNRISAWDLAVAARDMMANPDLAAVAGQQTYDFEGPDGIAYHIVSRNLHFLLSFPGAIGVKTGYTNAAGFCDIEEADKGGRKMMAVVLHSNNPDALAASLITKGFSIPVSAESADPVLPAVRQPTPAVAPRIGHMTMATDPAAARAAVIDTATRRVSNQDDWLDGIALAGIGLGAGLWLRQWLKRSRPAPAHRRTQ